MTPRRRVLGIGLFACAALAAAAGIAWQVGGGIRSRTPRPVPSALKAWKGGDLLACLVTVDGARLEEFAPQYNIVMMCGIRGPGNRFTDRSISVSRAFSIVPHDFHIEEAVSGPMRVLIADRARGHGNLQSPQSLRLHEDDLWYELALLPKGVDSFNVRTLSDVERLGGRLLLAEPRWSVISAWVL